MKQNLMTVLATLLVLFLMGAPLMAQQPQTAAGIQIVDAKLGKEVKDRQITEEASEFALNQPVYLWVKVAGGAGDSLTVTWKTGSNTYISTLAIGGSPWRTWCYKTAALAGDWTVTIADAKGNTLKELSFKAK